ncbi:MAG: hypothetical protein IJ181_07435 [Acidaminococcaceae bacterium]|nr:hypothetical protein [Acidaminococcaceae bacterium]
MGLMKNIGEMIGEKIERDLEKANAREYEKMQRDPDSKMSAVRRLQFKLQAANELVDEQVMGRKTGMAKMREQSMEAETSQEVKVYVNYVIPDTYFDPAMTNSLNHKYPDKLRVAMHTGKDDNSVNWEESLFLPVKGKGGEPLVMHMSDEMKKMSGLPKDKNYMIISFPEGQGEKLFINKAVRDDDGVVAYRKYMEQLKADMLDKIMKKLEPFIRARDTLNAAIDAARNVWNKGDEWKPRIATDQYGFTNEKITSDQIQAIKEQAKEAQKTGRETVETIAAKKVESRLSDKEVMDLIVNHKMPKKKERQAATELSDKEVMELIVKHKTAGKEKVSQAGLDYLAEMSPVNSSAGESIGYMARDIRKELVAGKSLSDIEQETRKSIMEHTKGDYQKTELAALNELISGVKKAEERAKASERSISDDAVKKRPVIRKSQKKESKKSNGRV